MSAPGRRMGLVYAAALGALGLAGLFATLGVPFWQTRQFLSGVKVGDAAAVGEMRKAAARLGGKARAATWAAIYARAPEWAAPGRANAWCLLAACGDAAEPVIRRLLVHPEPAVRAVGAEALGGVLALEAGARPARLGVRPDRAAVLLLDALADRDGRVRAAAAHALTQTGPAPLTSADAYLRCLAAGGWREVESARQGAYRAVHFQHHSLSEHEASDGAKPHRIVLSKTAGNLELVLGEWTSTSDYYHLGEPQFCTVAGRERPVLAFKQYCGGNGWGNQNLRVIALDDDLREITPQLPDGWYAKELRDINRDGKSELIILVAEYEFYMNHCHAASPGCSRVFRWDRENERFADASASFPGFYMKSIRRHREMMVSARNDPWAGAPVDLLLDFWCLGKAEQGWREFKAHMDRMKPGLGEGDRQLVEQMEADLRQRLNITAS